MDEILELAKKMKQANEVDSFTHWVEIPSGGSGRSAVWKELGLTVTKLLQMPKTTHVIRSMELAFKTPELREAFTSAIAGLIPVTKTTTKGQAHFNIRYEQPGLRVYLANRGGNRLELTGYQVHFPVDRLSDRQQKTLKRTMISKPVDGVADPNHTQIVRKSGRTHDEMIGYVISEKRRKRS